jgi:hypothetical protein
MSDDLSDQKLARRIAAILPGLRFPQQEQGSYTPTYEGGTTPGTTTYTFQSGAWTRIGNMVVVRGQVNWSAATGTGDAQVSLPFAPGTRNFTGSLWLIGVTFAAGTPQMQLSGGNTFFTMISPATNAAGTVVQMEAAGNIIWTVTYFL